MNRQSHNIEPVYNEKSKVLILGSFPSVKSREEKFFYAHPQNRFWKLLAALLEKEIPTSTEMKKELLLNSHIALWDVIQSCEIKGSSDMSITNVSVNDVAGIIKKSEINAVFCNGSKSYELYNRYLLDKTGFKATRLPSTSPANAACSFEKLLNEWRILLDHL